KYSPIGELGSYAAEYAESLNEAVGHIALITDQDVIIAVSGAPKKEFMERRVGGVIEGAMQHRQMVVVNDVEGEKPFPGTLLFDDDDDRRVAAYIAAPIVVG